MEALLKQKIASMALPIPVVNNQELVKSSLNGNTYGIISNTRGLKNVAVQFKNDQALLMLKTDSIMYTIPFGANKWVISETH
jgi:hypothetical protein